MFNNGNNHNNNSFMFHNFFNDLGLNQAQTFTFVCLTFILVGFGCYVFYKLGDNSSISDNIDNNNIDNFSYIISNYYKDENDFILSILWKNVITPNIHNLNFNKSYGIHNDEFILSYYEKTSNIFVMLWYTRLEYWDNFFSINEYFVQNAVLEFLCYNNNI